MRLSTSSIQFSTLPIEKACAQIAALGFEAIDFWPANFGCPHLDEIQNRLGAEGLKELLAKNKLKLCAFTCYGGGYPKYAETLGKIGGGVVVREADGGPASNQTAAMKAFFERLKPQIERAEKYNSYLAIENHGDNLLSSLDSIKAFVEVNRSPRVGLALAPWHLQREKISVEDAIAVAGKQLFFFYAWQFAHGVDQLPGVGPTDFTPWLAALAKIGYNRYVNPFMHDHPSPEKMAKALATSHAYMKKCYEKVVS